MPTRLGSTTHSYSGDVTAVASQTVAHAVGAGTNRLLTVGIGGRNLVGSSNNGHTVTWNGQALTMLAAYDLGSGNFDYAELWYLKEAGLSTTSANLVVTNSPNNQVVSLGAQAWSNVDQLATFGAVVTGRDAVGSLTASLTPVTMVGSEAIDVIGSYIPSGTPAMTPSGSLLWSEVDAVSAEDSSAQQSTPATATSMALTWTFNVASLWWALATSINSPGGPLVGPSRTGYPMGLGA